MGQAATQQWRSSLNVFNQNSYFLHATNSFAAPGASSSAACMWKDYILQFLLPYDLYLIGQEIPRKNQGNL